MLEVRGFRGIRFNPEVVGSLDNVVTPPFDVISPDERKMLAQRSPFNMVHIILPKEHDGLNPYEVAAHNFDTWIRQGVLRQDDNESFYLLEQTFRGLDGKERVRRGFFAVTRIPEEGEETVLPHERTFRHKIEDRLSLTAATQANLGAVFTLYDDPERVLGTFLDRMHERPEDALAVTFEGTTNRLWRLPYDPSVTEFFRERRLYIADGHHRFRTACEYRNIMREKEKPDGSRPYDYVLMGFVSFQDPGLLINPPHRVLDKPAGFDLAEFMRKLERWFEITKVATGVEERLPAESGCAFGLVVAGDGQYLLRLRDINREEFLGSDHGPAWRNLDVSVLHRGILENVLGIPEGTEFVYETDVKRAVESVTQGRKCLAFLVKPTLPQQVRDCADAREFMPQKATYFYPKLPSGGVIHRLV